MKSDQILCRAFHAYNLRCAHLGSVRQLPSKTESTVIRDTVTLRNAGRILAEYRITSSGQLVEAFQEPGVRS